MEPVFVLWLNLFGSVRALRDMEPPPLVAVLNTPLQETMREDSESAPALGMRDFGGKKPEGAPPPVPHAVVDQAVGDAAGALRTAEPSIVATPVSRYSDQFPLQPGPDARTIGVVIPESPVEIREEGQPERAAPPPREQLQAPRVDGATGMWQGVLAWICFFAFVANGIRHYIQQSSKLPQKEPEIVDKQTFNDKLVRMLKEDPEWHRGFMQGLSTAQRAQALDAAWNRGASDCAESKSDPGDDAVQECAENLQGRPAEEIDAPAQVTFG